MRIISFRVWDKEEKKYLLPEEQGFVILPTKPSFGVTIPFQSESYPNENLDIDCVDWADADLIMGRYELEQDTGLKDKNGEKIYENDILEFDDDDGIWRASVVFERGLYGLDVHHPKQVENPDGWNKDYDKVDSRGWAVKWGYEETGTAFSYRTPLAKATIFNGSPEEYEGSEHHERYKKYGYDSYCVDAQNIGNINENPDLLGDKE